MYQTVRGARRPVFGSAQSSSSRITSKHFIVLPRPYGAPVCRAAPVEEPPAATTEPAGTPAAKSTGELAKEALMQTIKSETVTSKDVLGESTLTQLRQALGEERAGQFIGALDGLLANRRLATLLFAMLDVALIWLLIKVFRATVMHE